MLCAFCSFVLFLSVFFVFHPKDLVLLNLISRYMSSTSEQLLKSKYIVYLCKVSFYISKLFIHCNTGGFRLYISGGVNIYLDLFRFVGAFVSSLCLFVCVWYQIRILAKPMSYVPNLSVNLTACCIKHLSRCCWYQDSTTLSPNIIKQNLLDVAWWHNQAKKQDSKKCR